MRVLSTPEANEVLCPLGLRVGAWNELASVSPIESRSWAYQPPRSEPELYVVAWKLAEWVAASGWVLLQIDNSTSPTTDEVEVFDALVFRDHKWIVESERTFLFDDSSELRCRIALLVFFALLFEWHVHLLSEQSIAGRRLSLQDGIAHFIGDQATVLDAKELTWEFVARPLQLDQ